MMPIKRNMTMEEHKRFHRHKYEVEKSGLIDFFTDKKYEEEKRNFIGAFEGLKYEEVDLNRFLVIMLKKITRKN